MYLRCSLYMTVPKYKLANRDSPGSFLSAEIRCDKSQSSIFRLNANEFMRALKWQQF